MVRESDASERNLPRGELDVGPFGSYAPVLSVVALSCLFVGAHLAFAPRRGPTGVFDVVEVVGEAALPVALLVLLVVMRDRLADGPSSVAPFVVGVSAFYFAALADFVDEIAVVHPSVTLVVEHAFAIVGAGVLTVGIVRWMRDYRERGRLLTRRERTLEETSAQLAALNRLLRHDIRNALNIISGYADLLNDHVTPDGRSHLATIERAVADAIALTESARAVTAALTERESMSLTAVAFRPLLERQVAYVREAYPRATVRVAGELPDVTVSGNELLSSLVQNLLINAVQHSDKAEPVVELSASVEGGTAVLRVADDGPGVPDDRKDVILRRGEKGIESEGTGIGLYLVETVVSACDGRLRIEDNSPEGVVFVVELPVLEAPPNDG